MSNEIKLVDMRDPEPTEHPHPEMRLTIKDIKKLPWFRDQSERYRHPIPFRFARRGGQVG